MQISKTDVITISPGGKIVNATIDQGVADPANGNLGELFYRIDLNAVRVFTNAGWETVGGGGPSVQPGQILYQVAFAYSDTSPKLITIILGAKVVYSAKIIITTAFNGTNSQLSIGDVGNAERLMSTTQNLPKVMGTYETTPSYAYGASTSVNITITPGTGCTQGAGYALIVVQE